MKKINRMNWIWPGGRLLLGLAVMGSALISVQPALAGKSCSVPVDVTFRDLLLFPRDRIVGVAGVPAYTAVIACGDGDLRFNYGPLNFRLDALGPEWVQSNGNMVVELGTVGGLLDMTVGQSLPTTKVQFTLEKGRTSRYFLAFRDDPLWWPDSDNILVTRVSPTEWEVEAAPPIFDKDGAVVTGWSAQLLTIVKAKYNKVAVEPEVPFMMTLTCQEPLPPACQPPQP